MRPPFRLVPDSISGDTIEALTELLADARAGNPTTRCRRPEPALVAPHQGGVHHGNGEVQGVRASDQ